MTLDEAISALRKAADDNCLYVQLPIYFVKKIEEKLEEQKPVKPKSKTRHGEYPQIVHRCGKCNEILYKYYKFCPSCGRGVKWNDTD